MKNVIPESRLEEAFSGSRVLVTGGAGFVGSSVAHRLVEHGARVTILDDFTTGRPELVPAGVAELVTGSVTDAPLVERLVGASDYVFHMAARVLSSSTSDVRADYEVNIGGMLNILLALRDGPGHCRRLVYTSTTSIYGNPSHLPVIEDEKPTILSPYAASKHAAESYCSVFYEMYGLRHAIVRYSNIYGPRQSPANPYCGVISKFLSAALRGEPMQIHGSGMQTRDFTYIDDAVTATLLAAIVPRAEGSVFNVGTGVETSVHTLATTINELLPHPVELRLIDRRDIDNVQRRVMNIERARQILRWMPRVHLRAGLAETLRWISESAASRPEESAA